MNKMTKAFLLTGLLASIGYAAVSYADITPEEKALQVLKRNELYRIDKELTKDHTPADKINQLKQEADKVKELQISEISIPIYEFPFGLGEGTVYFERNKNKSLVDLLQITDEKLGFTEADGGVDGVIVTNSVMGVAMTRGYVGEVLLTLYHETLKHKRADAEVKYLDVYTLGRVRGMFVTTDRSGKDIALLSPWLAEDFQLKPNKVYPAEEVLAIWKMHIIEGERMNTDPAKMLFGDPEWRNQPVFIEG